MASVEGLVVSKVIEEQDLKPLLDLGIKPQHFAGDWEDIYSWVVQRYRDDGDVPSERAFKKAWGDVSLPDAEDESFNRLATELLDAYKYRVVTDTLTDVMPKLDVNNVDDILDKLHKGLQTATVETSRLKDVDIVSTWEGRYEKYIEMSNTPNAIKGIKTGFVGLDAITHGFRPQQFVVLAGEPKRGKSLFALIMAHAAHTAGRVPLFLSFEMNNEEQSARYDALQAHVPYDRLLSGTLSSDELERVRQVGHRDRYMDPIWMSEDSSRLTTLSAVAGKIQEFKPDIVFIDGMYMMDDENGEPRGSPQALTNITRGTKRMAQHFDIPIFGTTQVLASKVHNTKTRAVTSDALGYTSSWAQDADLILGVERHPDMDDRAIIRVVEGRTVGSNQEIHIQWDWKTMEFEEIFEYQRRDDEWRQEQYG